MLELLNQGWFGSLVGIIGVVIGIVLYRISKIGARPTCQMRGYHIIGQAAQEFPSEIQILYGNKSIPRLTYTSIYFWNAGKQTMRGSEIVADDPLRFEFDSGDEILTVEIEICTRRVNKLNASIPSDAKNQALVMFDFLDPQDGARIGILHSSQNLCPKSLGTIRGIPSGVTEVNRVRRNLFDATQDRMFPNLDMRISRAISLAFDIVLLPIGLLIFIIGIMPIDWLFELLQPSFSHIFNKLLIGHRISIKNLLLIMGCCILFINYYGIKGRHRPYPAILDGDIADSNKNCETP